MSIALAPGLPGTVIPYSVSVPITRQTLTPPSVRVVPHSARAAERRRAGGDHRPDRRGGGVGAALDDAPRQPAPPGGRRPRARPGRPGVRAPPYRHEGR